MSGTVVVTGGASGIGLATTHALLEGGWSVHVLDLQAPAEAHPQATFHRCDVSQEEQVAAAMTAAVGPEGQLVGLVNCAGVNAYDKPDTMSSADWDAVFGADLKGAWLCVKHALAGLTRAARAGGDASIVNISSIHSAVTLPGMFPYAAAKAGLEGLTRSMALELGAASVRVNAVAPGFTRTRLVEEWLSMQDDPEAVSRDLLAVHPLGRIAEPEDVASVVRFLISPAARAMTGAVVRVDCGLSARMAT